MKQIFKVLVLILGVFFSQVAYASEIDSRFYIHIDNQKDYPNMTITDALQFALPILWKRVVPDKDLAKTYRFKGRRSLVLQYKKVKRGVDLVFNPVQVRSYLYNYGIEMVPVLPKWNLKISVIGFSDNDDSTALDLMNYTYGMANKLGFELTPRGKKLQLIFAPVVDAYGQSFVHVDVQGAFPKDILGQTDKPVQGYLSYQLQAWMGEIVREIRDAYALRTLQFEDVSSQRLLTIEAEYTLATQVMLEQALREDPRVNAVVPQLLQKARRQYLIVLNDDDDQWLETWFSAYGLTATAIIEGGVNHWFVE